MSAIAISNHWKNLRPERGWRLFAAVVIGTAVAVSGHAFIIDSGLFLRLPWWSLFPILVFPIFCGQAWQAWLLFRRDPVRLVLWTLLPMDFLLGGYFNQFLVFRFYLVLLLGIWILWGVRRHAWIWLIAAVVGTNLGGQFGVPFSTQPLSILESFRWMGDGTAAFVANRLQAGLYYSALWFDDVLCAAALAWLMPPVVPRSDSIESAP